MTSLNLVDQAKFTRSLVHALRAHVDACSESIAAKIDGQGSHTTVTPARPIAVAWVYTTVLVAWAEDHGLIDPWLRADAQVRRKEFLSLPGMTMSAWLARAIASLCRHPATACLLDPRYNPLRQAAPSNQVISHLVEWWTHEAPSLCYEVEQGPSSLSGWLPGDLLQHLSDERRKGFALTQTPWWVADFILDLTLVPAAEEFRDLTLRTIDPSCGTGHFLIRTIDYLWELYTTGQVAPRQITSRKPVTGWRRVGAAEAINRVLAGAHGCEKDPLTAAVARLRYVVAIGELMRRAGLTGGSLRLDSIPPFQPPIVVGDSLLAGAVSKQEYADLHPKLALIVNLGNDQPTAGQTPDS
ncbi:hypothetical protein ACFY4C_41350 [Actinomadura viridis]|uniref:hypothetical protein n=1 Tax=Actinomadura viridis TaxID=58110 RepID=UPI0036770E5E